MTSTPSHTGSARPMFGADHELYRSSVAELPALVRLQARATGLRVLAVNTDRSHVDAAAFLKANNARELVPYRDSDIIMLKSFKAYGLPLTVLIDPEGKIVARAEGPAEWDSPEAIKYFRRVTGS